MADVVGLVFPVGYEDRNLLFAQYHVGVVAKRPGHRLAFDGRVVTIDLTGIAPENDLSYENEEHEDNYRRTTVSRTVYVRNLVL